MKLGLFGGSFDPPHIGHLLVAVDAYEALGLDRLIFIPTGIQPLKVGRAVAQPGQRLEMVKRLVGADPRFAVDPIEIERSGLSYTVDTLAALKAREVGAELFLLVGADVPESFAKWREPGRIVELATLVVLERSGERPDLSALPGRPRSLATRRVDVSSTEIRARVAAGKSIRGFVPDAVGEFIAAERLYCQGTE